MKLSHRRRILMLLQNNPYPQDTRVHDEARALTDAGYQVSVICPAAPSQRRYEFLEGVHVYRYPAPRTINSVLGYFWEYGYSMTLTFLLSVLVLFRRGFDVVHTHNPPDTFVFIAAFYKLLLGKRYVYDHHDLCPETYTSRFGANSKPIVHKALLWVESLCFRFADHVIATNQSYKRIEMQRGNVHEDRITIVRNGPNLRRMRLVEPDPTLRQPGKTVFAYLGIMGYQDGVDYLIRALHHLRSDLGRDDFFCLVIGKGDALDDLKALAERLGLSDYMCFTGWASGEQLVRYLSSADIYVDPDPSNPLNDSSTMVKMMEYMALGKPIVAFDLPEHRVTAQEAALYVRPNDELSFAHGLMALMDDGAQRQRMGEIGRRRIESDLEWRHSVPHLLSVYQTLWPTYAKEQVMVLSGEE